MMKRLIACLAAALICAPAFAKLPPAPPMSDADKAAKAAKAAASKTRDAEMLQKAKDKAVANYMKNKGLSGSKDAPMAAVKAGKKK